MIGIDTNVLLRWLLDDDPGQSRRAAEFIDGLTAARPGFVTSVTMMELAWVLRAVCKFPKARILDTLEGLLLSAELEFDDGESLVRAVELARAGADFPDAYISDMSQLFGCDEVVTFDQGAARKLGMRLLS